MRALSLLQREPVRVHLYGVLVAVLAVLGAYGYVREDLAFLWLALGAAVLGVVGVEGARTRVVPVAKLEAAEIAGAAAVPPTGAATGE